MNYGDLFTGVGGFSLAMKRVFPSAFCSYWSEINKSSIQTYLKNFPHNHSKNIGDISSYVFDENGEPNDFRIGCLPRVDFLFAGSPCQDLSIQTKNRKGLKGSRSNLFYAFAHIVRVKKPKYFLLENVASMSEEDRDTISEVLGVQPMRICSDFITPQMRDRLYWFNWDIETKDLWDRGVRNHSLVRWSKSGRTPKPDGTVLDTWKQNENGKYYQDREYRDGKANTLTGGWACSGQSSKTFVDDKGTLRELTPEEAEVLQSFPPGWTEGVSDNQRYKQIGNAVTVKVIETILRGIKNV